MLEAFLTPLFSIHSNPHFNRTANTDPIPHQDAAIVAEDASKANIRKFLNRLLCVEVEGQVPFLMQLHSDSLCNYIVIPRAIT